MLAFALRNHPDVAYQHWPIGNGDFWEEIEEFHRGQAPVSIITTHHNWGENWAKNQCGMLLEDVWVRLAEMHDKAVLVRRENPLKRYLSIKVSETLGIYVTEPRKETIRITINPLEFARWAIWTSDLWARMREHFHDALIFSYEQLTAYWPFIIGAVQRHLGLWEMPLSPVTIKQEVRPLEDIVENYDELTAFFEKELNWADWLKG